MSKQTPISQVGETGLIEHIKTIVTTHAGDESLTAALIKGIGDDTAVFRPSPGKVALMTTDAFVEGVHFDLTFNSFQHLGWKAMAANLSDIASMGGTPRYATVFLSLPAKISVEMIEDFYRGAVSACKKYDCLIVGGDTTASIGNMCINVMLYGEAEEKKLLYRSGAKPGDLLCVTGHLGASHSGLKILQREKRRFVESGADPAFEPNLKLYSLAIEKHLAPKPRLDLSPLLAGEFRAHAMIDISDGLASEVHRLCAAGNVGAAVYEHNLPVDVVTQAVAEEFKEKATDYALYGGEEYELLFTITDELFEKLDAQNSDVTIIGRITKPEDGVTIVRENGESEMLPFGGWDHFPAQA